MWGGGWGRWWCELRKDRPSKLFKRSKSDLKHISPMRALTDLRFLRGPQKQKDHSTGNSTVCRKE